MKNLLSAEQSATLISKGISADKASEIKEYDDEVSQWTHRGAPIFTLADILDILPKEIEDYHLSIESFKETHYVAYIRDNNDDYLLPHKDAPQLIDALYSLLVWCLEKGYVS